MSDAEKEIGFVYILQNEAMPGMYKIGVTGKSDVNARVNELYSTSVPVPFDIVFACRVENNKNFEGIIHNAFADKRVNPSREFFTVEPGRVIPLLKHLQVDDFTIEMRKMVEGQATVEDKVTIERHRPKYNLIEMGIPIGSSLEFDDVDNPVKAEVFAERRVIYNGKEYKLGELTSELMGVKYFVRPTLYWKYNGRLLEDIYNEIQYRLPKETDTDSQ
jgi:hypothetical protein